jgi:hypothetical protein
MLELIMANLKMLALAGAGVLALALVLLVVVLRDIYVRLGACEVAAEAAAASAAAAPPGDGAAAYEDAPRPLPAQASGPAYAPEERLRQRSPESRPHEDPAATAAHSSKRGAAQNPCARRRGGIAHPGASTRRSRVRVNEFTPSTAAAGDDAPAAPEKVIVRRVSAPAESDSDADDHDE